VTKLAKVLPRVCVQVFSSVSGPHCFLDNNDRFWPEGFVRGLLANLRRLMALGAEHASLYDYGHDL
jgi:hypothetical protein